MKRDELEGDLTSVVAERVFLSPINEDAKQRMEVLTSRVADLKRVNCELELNRETRDHLLREKLQTQKTTENKVVDKLDTLEAALT